MMYKDVLCKGNASRPEEWHAKSGGGAVDSPAKCGSGSGLDEMLREGTPCHTLNSIETGSVTTSVLTSRFDDMDSWVDDDECFYQSLREDLAKAQQAVQNQAQQATWKKVEAPSSHFGAGQVGRGRGGRSHHHHSHGKPTGGRGSAHGSRSDNSSSFAPASAGPTPAASGGRFDALAPLSKRFR